MLPPSHHPAQSLAYHRCVVNGYRNDPVTKRLKDFGNVQASYGGFSSSTSGVTAPPAHPLSSLKLRRKAELSVASATIQEVAEGDPNSGGEERQVAGEPDRDTHPTLYQLGRSQHRFSQE